MSTNNPSGANPGDPGTLAVTGETIEIDFADLNTSGGKTTDLSNVTLVKFEIFGLEAGESIVVDDFRAVPEPSAALLDFLGALTLLKRRRV